MKTKAISSIFLLFTIAAGIISMSPASFADHSETIIYPISGSGSPGCELTESGSAFMSTFNELYYTFSPTIADMERESPVFKEIVKAGLTPMLSTLAIMDNAESESEVLGLGLSVIALNLGMYIGLPAFGILRLYEIKKQ